MELRSILIILLLVAIAFFAYEEIEGFRGGRRGGRGGRRGGGRGGRGGRRGGGRGGGRGRRLGGRRGYGGRRPGYGGRRHLWRRGPVTTVYDGSPYYWGGYRGLFYPPLYNYYPSWLYTARCRTGCGYLGNGSVGCVNPTNTPDSCIFASDCYGC